MIQRRLKPGQPSTKKYDKKHSADLVCVRYRYDAEKKIKSKTVEIIVEQSHWEPDGKRIPKNKIMNIRINLNEAGGFWKINHDYNCYKIITITKEILSKF